ncbi:MAG: condensation domain-containing protein, partial [Chloroflexota bacterium]
GGRKRYVMFFKVHHIVFDGWSNEILLKEISEVYNSLAQGITPKLEDLRLDYAAYSERLRGEDEINKRRDYWLEKMTDFPGNLQLPTDFPRNGAASFEGNTHILGLDIEKLESLKKISEKLRCSLFDVAAAAVYVLLYIESSQKDITLGIPLSGRTEPELENVVGYFINTMPLRLKLDGEKPISDLIRQIRDNIVQMNANQAYPFDRLVEEMDLKYGETGSPAFDIIVNAYSADLDALALDGVKTSVFGDSSFFSKYDLQFYYEEKEEINIIIEYKTALFKPETIERFAGEINQILEMITGSEALALDDVRQRIKAEDKRTEEEDFRNSLLYVSEEF